MATASKITSFTNIRLGDQFNVFFTSYNSAHTHILKLYIDNTSGTLLKTINSYMSGSAISFTSAEVQSIYSALGNSTSCTVMAQLTTKSGNTTIGTSTKTATLAMSTDNAPTFLPAYVSYQDADATIVAKTGDNQKIVRNKSTLRVYVNTAAVAKNGATIVEYEIVTPEGTHVLQSTGYADCGAIDSASNINVYVTAVDSRGMRTTVALPVIVLDWYQPNMTVRLQRVNNFETNTEMEVHVNYASVGGTNSVAGVMYKARKVGDEWPAGATSASADGTTIISLPNTNAYDVMVSVRDVYARDATEVVASVGKGISPLFIDFYNQAIGVGGYPQTGDAAYVNGLVRANSLSVNGALQLATLISDINFSSGTLEVENISKYTLLYFYLSGEATRVLAIRSGSYVRGGIPWVNASGDVITYAVSCSVSGDVLTYVNSGYMKHSASGNHGAWVQKAITAIVGVI